MNWASFAFGFLAALALVVVLVVVYKAGQLDGKGEQGNSSGGPG